MEAILLASSGWLFSWFLWLLIAALTLGILSRATCGMFRSKRRVDGKIFVITGSNQGIGFETALELALRGGHVILACRNPTRADLARQQIESALEQQQAAAVVQHQTSSRHFDPHSNGDAKRQTSTSEVLEGGSSGCESSTHKKGRVSVLQLDLCSFASVRLFVRELSQIVPHVDVLINNAGLLTDSKTRVSTVDGLEETYQSNYFGHFLLTNLMLPLLQKSPGTARVINVTSLLYLLGRASPSMLVRASRGTGRPIGGPRYMDTKLAIVMWTRELAKRTKGTGVTVNCVHPGLALTNITLGSSILSIGINKLAYLYGKTPREGAQTQLYVAVSDIGEKISGCYFQDCMRFPLVRGLDPATNKAFWDVTQQIIDDAERKGK